MGFWSDFFDRIDLANVASATCIIAGLYIGYATGNAELIGVIVGASLTWLYYRKPSDVS